MSPLSWADSGAQLALLRITVEAGPSSQAACLAPTSSQRERANRIRQCLGTLWPRQLRRARAPATSIHLSSSQPVQGNSTASCALFHCPRRGGWGCAILQGGMGSASEGTTNPMGNRQMPSLLQQLLTEPTVTELKPFTVHQSFSFSGQRRTLHSVHAFSQAQGRHCLPSKSEMLGYSAVFLSLLRC